MLNRRKGDKVLHYLAEAVGLKCTITLVGGEVVSGVLRGFRRGPPFILYIVGGSRMFINFHYVVRFNCGGISVENKSVRDGRV